MGEEDYRSTGSGGLKLKGVKDGRVDKKHKKKKGKVSPKPDAEKEDLPGSQILDEPLRDDDRGTKSDAEQHTPSEEAGETVGKTEAERKHEETRRKRVSLLRALRLDVLSAIFTITLVKC